MTATDLQQFLSTIGKSGTRAASEDSPEVIGQFGIGFLSGFVVGARVEVRTRHWGTRDREGCLWENSGNKDYTIQQLPIDFIGSEVTIHLRSAEDRHLLHDDSIKNVVREYADMLRIPIRLNDPGHQGSAINAMVMPWERTALSGEDAPGGNHLPGTKGT